MSSSPSTKRNLKPSPIAAAHQPNLQPPTTTEVPGLPTAGPFSQISTDSQASAPQPPSTPASSKKRKSISVNQPIEAMASSTIGNETQANTLDPPVADADTSLPEPKAKKSRTNTPWTPAEELRLKHMRDAGNSWSEIAKTFPQRTEGSVKKHWYKDMHYAEFAEDDSTALLAAIKEYDANKWKVIGQKVGKPAKACEQYAKEHFGGKY